MSNPIYRFKLKVPSGYQRLTYLQSDGTAYINTGVAPQANEVTQIIFQYDRSESAFVIGCRATQSSKRFLIGRTGSGTVASLGTTGNTVIGNNNLSQKIVVLNTGTGKASMNNATPVSVGTFQTTTVPICLFCCNNNGTMVNKSHAKIMSCTIGSRANFVPVVRLVDGVLGMYDTFNETFKTNAGSGQFIAGQRLNTIYEEGMTEIPVNPVYKDDLSIEYEKESQQQFFRRKLSGKIDFIGEDFYKIMAQNFETEYHVLLEMSTDNGHTWSQYWHGKFMRTDCTVNIDDKKITVQPEVVDEYTDILAGMEKEYNLIELAPAIDRVRITKRAALQVYLQGDDKLTYIVNGLSFESSCSSVDNRIQLQNEHFSTIGRFRELVMKQNNVLYNIYQGIVPVQFYGSYTGIFTTSDNLTYVQLNVSAPGGSIGSISYAIKRISDDTVLWSYSNSASPSDVTSFDMSPLGGSGTMHCDVNDRTLWTRILCDVMQFNGRDTYALEASDMSYDNRNYRRCIDFNLSGDYIINNRQFSDTPTEWGRTNDGKYFMKPVEFGSPNFYPVGRSQWIYTSLWIKDDGTLANYLTFGDKQAEILTNYTLASVLKVLLATIAPDVTFGETSAYSQFLYGDTHFGIDSYRLLMTPKSNVMAGEFSQPAMKATITIRDVLNMLRDVFCAYWYIDSSNRLRIEHIEFFKNGGSYSTQPTIGIDLTEMKVSRNGKAWAFAKNEYTFNKEDMPQRYQFEWMDEVSEAFVGKPLEIISKYVKEGKIEDITIGSFTTDVDYILLAPEDISKDGFALFAGTLSSGVYVLPIGSVAMTSAKVQNQVLAFPNIIPEYWTYDLPSPNAEMGGNVVTVNGTLRNRKQSVNVPTGDSDPDMNQLIKTGLGNGQIEKMSINLSSRMAKTTLRYATEQ